MIDLSSPSPPPKTSKRFRLQSPGLRLPELPWVRHRRSPYLEEVAFRVRAGLAITSLVVGRIVTHPLRNGQRLYGKSPLVSSTETTTPWRALKRIVTLSPMGKRRIMEFKVILPER